MVAPAKKKKKKAAVGGADAAREGRGRETPHSVTPLSPRDKAGTVSSLQWKGGGGEVLPPPPAAVVGSVRVGGGERAVVVAEEVGVGESNGSPARGPRE